MRQFHFTRTRLTAAIRRRRDAISSKWGFHFSSQFWFFCFRPQTAVSYRLVTHRPEEEQKLRGIDEKETCLVFTATDWNQGRARITLDRLGVRRQDRGIVAAVDEAGRDFWFGYVARGPSKSGDSHRLSPQSKTWRQKPIGWMTPEPKLRDIK